MLHTENSYKETYLPEITYGGVNGLISTFSIISSIEGANLSKTIIIILGFANVLSDAFSMGVSSYLSNETSVEKLKPLKKSIATFLSYFLLGLIPIIPFIFHEKYGFLICYIVTLFMIFYIGTMKGKTKSDKITEGGYTLLLGGVASILSYFTGKLAKYLISTV
jgi:vacuolar iron transporter family protein